MNTPGRRMSQECIPLAICRQAFPAARLLPMPVRPVPPRSPAGKKNPMSPCELSGLSPIPDLEARLRWCWLALVGKTGKFRWFIDELKLGERSAPLRCRLSKFIASAFALADRDKAWFVQSGDSNGAD